MKVAAVDALKATYPVPLLLRIAQLSRSVYHYHHRRPDRSDRVADLKDAIQEIFVGAHGRYGHRRIHAALKQAGWRVAKKTVLTLMRDLGLVCHVRRRQVHSSYRGEVGSVAPNHLDRQFTTMAPNTVWVSDVTEFRIGDEKIYLSPVMDLFDRQIISYTVGVSPSLNLVLPALDAALATLQEGETPLVHTDQGALYQHRSWQQRLTTAGARPSMSRKGTCLDNAVIESFFSTVKTEMFHHVRYLSVPVFLEELHAYIAWYNNDRLSTNLGNRSPVQYRQHRLAA